MVYDESDDQQSVQRSQTDDSRRKFLAGSAGVLGALTLGGAFGSQSVLAQEDDGGDTGQEPPEADFESDVEVLNYALTLEYLEAAFYREGLNNIGQDDLFGGDGEVSHLSAVPEEVQSHLYGQLEVVLEHEETHVEALNSLISDIGGEPVDEPEFDFGSAVEDPAEFVQTAVALEDTGVGAYAGAAPFIENEGLLLPALSVHSVEGRHAAFVRALAGESPFPEAFDAALSEEEVIGRVNEYVAGDELEASTDGNTTDGNVTDDNTTAGNETDGDETPGNPPGDDETPGNSSGGGPGNDNSP